MKKYKNYEDVPWLRKAGVNSCFAVIGMISSTVSYVSWYFASNTPGGLEVYALVYGAILLPSPFIFLVLIPCFALITGGIYRKEKDEDGFLISWGTAGKIFAWLIFIYASPIFFAIFLIFS